MATDTAAIPRYLTKSRFMKALECPTKLFYVGKPDYVNASLEDSFLATLAEGGHQVGALAQLMYPGGVSIDDVRNAAQLERTRVLLGNENVTIYEAALQTAGLFVRVDVLRKQGNVVELIEAKAKSYDPGKDRDFRGARNVLKSEFRPYLQDIAFQRHVAALAYPQFQYRCFLMLVDKTSATTVDGLNQRFKIRRVATRVSIDVAPETNAAMLGAPNAITIGRL